MTTKDRLMLGGVALALALTGCAGSTESAQEAPSSPDPLATTSTPAEATPTETRTPTAPSTTTEPATSAPASSATDRNLPPDRSEMDETILAVAEIFVVGQTRELGIGELYSDQELIDAAHLTCDSWESGKPIRGVLVDVAEALPRLESTEAVAQFAGVATGILCSDYLPEG